VAERAPGAAVMEAFSILERALRQKLQATNIDAEPDVRIGAVGLARIAAREGLITDETLRAVEGVAVLRNLAAHGHEREISPERAREYLTLMDAVLYALDATPPSVPPM
jgi:hypothetical protein